MSDGMIFVLFLLGLFFLGVVVGVTVTLLRVCRISKETDDE